MQFHPSYGLVEASPLPMDTGYLSLVGSNILFNGCSAGSCNFGDLAGENECTSFYSTILNGEAEVPVLWLMWRDDSADSIKPNSEINPLYRWEVRNLLEYKEVEVNKSVVETEIPPISIHLGCYNTIPEAGWLRKSRILFLTVREAGKSKINILEDSVSGKKLLLPWWPSSLCFHIVEKAKELSLVDLFSSLIFKFLAIQCNMQNFAN